MLKMPRGHKKKESNPQNMLARVICTGHKLSP